MNVNQTVFCCLLLFNVGHNCVIQLFVDSLWTFSSIWEAGKEWGNFTSDEKDTFLEEVLGPQKKYGNNKILIPTIFYSTISVLGIPGNILTCMTIVMNSYMRTAPNFFIFNLAMTDLITLILGNTELFYIMLYLFY